MKELGGPGIVYGGPLVEQPKTANLGTFSKLDLSWMKNEQALKDLLEFEIEVVTRWPSGAINPDYTYLSREQTIHHVRSSNGSSFNEISLISIILLILNLLQ